MNSCVALVRVALIARLCAAARPAEIEDPGEMARPAEIEDPGEILDDLKNLTLQQLVKGQKKLGKEFYANGACARAHGDWSFTKKKEGWQGAVGQISIVHDNHGKAYIMKEVKVKLREMDMTRDIQVTKEEFAREIAAQNIAASLGLAVPVVDAFLCEHAAGSKVLTVGIIIMPKIEGVNLADHINDAGTTLAIRCAQNMKYPAPSVNGSMSLEGYEKLKSSIVRLNNAGVFINDFHGGNAMVQEGTGKLIFVDFGLPFSCAMEPGVLGWAIQGQLGCTIPPADESKPEFEDFDWDCADDA